ncbi:hypothetical protein MAL1_00220 [Bacteriophage DSS3_MAL1]|nr:hypothetical protein MAL1_00220 [Bacteriophage DSS3_MAL1]
MTHNGLLPPEEIKWEDCEMDRYDSNNGIVLRDMRRKPFGDVMFYIDGADIGFVKTDHGPEVLERAEPIFKTMLSIHNRAVREGKRYGRRQAKNEFRRWLEDD